MMLITSSASRASLRLCSSLLSSASVHQKFQLFPSQQKPRFLSTDHDHPHLPPPKPSKPEFVAINLNAKRRLLRVSGLDSFIYLQALISNDMRRLLPLDRLQAVNRRIYPELFDDPTTGMGGVNNQPVIYAYMISCSTRVLADLFIYRGRYRAEEGEYILEVDAQLATAIKRLLLGYNLGRNAKVEIATDFDLWSILPMSALAQPFTKQSQQQEQEERSEFYNQTPPPNPHTEELLEEIDSDDLKLVRDPRLGPRALGYRLLTRLGGKDLEQIGPYIKLPGGRSGLRLYEGTWVDYTKLRYQLGVAEGQDECLSAFYYPTELNGDLLQAVSLNKGLYVAEEKVTKTYSYGPVKRRIVPVEFLCSLDQVRQLHPAPRTYLGAIQGPDRPLKTRFGELRGRIGRYGIACLPVPLENTGRTPSLFNRREAHRTGHWFPRLVHEDTGIRVRARLPTWWGVNFDLRQLPVPEDYPRSLFDFEAQKLPPPVVYPGIREDPHSTDLLVVQQ